MNPFRAWRQQRKRRADHAYGPRIELPGGQQEWIEKSLDWYVDQFGDEPLRRKIVLPSEFVPADYDGSEEAALALCRKVAERLEIPSDKIRFSFRMAEVREAARSNGARELRTVFRKNAESGDPALVTEAREILAMSGLPILVAEHEVEALVAAGLGPELEIMSRDAFVAEALRCGMLRSLSKPEYRTSVLQKFQASWAEPAGAGAMACWRDLRTTDRGPSTYDASAIMLSRTILSNPAAVVAVVVHELGHEVLNRSGRVTKKQPDGEALVDLFSVFHGFGIFSLNQSMERADGGRYRRIGYLGERGFTDAMANYLSRRHLLLGEPLAPAWRKEIDLGVRLVVIGRAGKLVENTA